MILADCPLFVSFDPTADSTVGLAWWACGLQTVTPKSLRVGGLPRAFSSCCQTNNPLLNRSGSIGQWLGLEAPALECAGAAGNGIAVGIQHVHPEDACVLIR